MNCKPGDLAILVRSDSGNAGKIVRCVRLHPNTGLDADGRSLGRVSLHPRWVIDPPLPNGAWGLIFTAPDVYLRPIRDSDGTDETLLWAGKPQPVEA